MNFFQVLILSVVEGITEFLPISSTGHLILVSDLFKIPQTEFQKSFEIIIQLGAIFAVIILYWRTILFKKEIWLKILTAFLPTAILGFTLYKIIKSYLLGNTWVTLSALFLGGIALIILEKIYKDDKNKLERVDQLSFKQAFIIGLFQSVSMIPGVSRAAATIFGGLFSGLKRKEAVEFSFLLAIPTMFAATGLDLVKNSFSFTFDQWLLLIVGFIGAFITAIFAVKYFLRFIQKHTFTPFGIYRIILSLISWWYFIVFR